MIFHLNIWLIAAIALLLGVIPCGLVCLRGTRASRLVALQLASVLAVLALWMVAQGMQRSSLDDLALTLALLSFPGALVYARFLERGDL